jgi:hypothetical protein
VEVGINRFLFLSSTPESKLQLMFTCSLSHSNRSHKLESVDLTNSLRNTEQSILNKLAPSSWKIWNPSDGT